MSDGLGGPIRFTAAHPQTAGVVVAPVLHAPLMEGRAGGTACVKGDGKRLFEERLKPSQIAKNRFSQPFV